MIIAVDDGERAVWMETVDTPSSPVLMSLLQDRDINHAIADFYLHTMKADVIILFSFIYWWIIRVAQPLLLAHK